MRLKDGQDLGQRQNEGRIKGVSVWEPGNQQPVWVLLGEEQVLCFGWKVGKYLSKAWKKESGPGWEGLA